MKTLTLEEAKQRVGEIVPAIKCVLSKLYERKSGTNNVGEWSIQNGELSDSTGILRVMFNGRDEIPEEYVGKEIILSSTMSKHGMYGVKVEEEEYKGKKYVQVRVSQAAAISLFEEKAVVEKAKENMNRFLKNEAKKDGNGIKVARERLMQLTNMWDLSFDAATFLQQQKKFDAVLVKDIATTLFIQAVREGLANNMPADKPLHRDDAIIQEPPEEEADPF
ncbi:MAG: hypothetical protein QXH80_00010 [Candidatus Nanoarchaeia archaeon]